jgi:crotonobetainyl-CoA:carnitine CoA-transferase CaiB-like acyl-CoA transferase
MAGPLTGVRVVDLSQVVSGPLAGGWLADQGADVIKVEGPGGDPVRWLGPTKGDLSSTYISINRGKRAVAADLKTDDGRALVAALIERADVLIENFRPGVLDKLGFGWAAARAINPRLIYCSITGYGRDGPYAGLRAYDPMIQASSGIAATQPGPDGEPQLIKTLICDKVTGLTAAQGITAALFARERSGEGQRIEVAMLDAALAFNWPEGSFNQGFMDEPPPVSPAAGRFTRLWKTRDGSVALASFQDHEFTGLCAALNRPDLAADERFATGGARARNIRLWGPILAEAVANLTSAEFMDGCLKHGAGGSVVHSLDEVLDNPQVIHNGAIAVIDHGALGRVRTARHPIRFSGTPVPAPLPAGTRGEHSAQVRAELNLPPA